MAKVTTEKPAETVVVDTAESAIAETVVSLSEPATAENIATNEELTTVVNTESTEVLQQTETVVIFRVNRPLMPHEYEELEKRVRLENEKSGLKIVLAPYSVDVELTGG
jgi:hypothetical protein